MCFAGVREFLFLSAFLAVRTMNNEHLFEISWCPCPLMRDAGSAMLVDERAAVETIDSKRGCEWVGFVIGDGIGKYVARPGSRFKPPCAPSTIEIESFDRGLTDDGACVGAGVDNATPISIHPTQTASHAIRNGFRPPVSAAP